MLSPFLQSDWCNAAWIELEQPAWTYNRQWAVEAAQPFCKSFCDIQGWETPQQENLWDQDGNPSGVEVSRWAKHPSRKRIIWFSGHFKIRFLGHFGSLSLLSSPTKEYRVTRNKLDTYSGWEFLIDVTQTRHFWIWRSLVIPVPLAKVCLGSAAPRRWHGKEKKRAILPRFSWGWVHTSTPKLHLIGNWTPISPQAGLSSIRGCRSFKREDLLKSSERNGDRPSHSGWPLTARSAENIARVQESLVRSPKMSVVSTRWSPTPSCRRVAGLAENPLWRQGDQLGGLSWSGPHIHMIFHPWTSIFGTTWKIRSSCDSRRPSMTWKRPSSMGLTSREKNASGWSVTWNVAFGSACSVEGAISSMFFDSPLHSPLSRFYDKSWHDDWWPTIFLPKIFDFDWSTQIVW